MVRRARTLSLSKRSRSGAPASCAVVSVLRHVEWDVYAGSKDGRLAVATPDTITQYDAVFYRPMGWKTYELKDWLGTPRLTFSDIKLPLELNIPYADYHYQLDYLSISTTYPFGARIDSLSFERPSYRFGFTGHLKDNNIRPDKGDGANYSTLFREYDAVIGRWWSADPLRAKYAGMSPYNYAAGNPVSYVDKYGDELGFEINSGDPDKIEYVSIGLNGYQNSDGTPYKGEINNAMKSVMKDIDIMKLTPIGNATVSHLIDSKNRYTIFEHDENDFDADKKNDGMLRATWKQFSKSNPEAAAEIFKNDPTINSGTGGRIGYYPEGQAVPEEGIMKKRPSIGLFHEFRHAMDADLGMMNYEIFNGISGNEWRTTYYESVYRMQLKDLGVAGFEGIGRRSHYKAEKIPGTPLQRPSGSSLFDKEGNPYIPEQFK